MLWVIQNNLFNEAGYARFVEALERLGLEYITVKPVPFTNKLLPHDFDSATQDFEDTEEPFIDPNQKIMAFGATSLTRISQSKGWIPGTYLNDNFDFEVWRDGFGADNVLNSDAVIGPVHSIANVHNHDHVFVRPTLDTKAIAGTVMSKYDFEDWYLQVGQIEEEPFLVLHKNTEMIVSSVKEIYSECRLFVVNGNVVTASMYKFGNTVRGDADVDDRFIRFVQKLTMGVWTPADAFVIDVADTPDGLKVIEINNINSAGYYAADVQKIIMALEELNR